MDTLETQKLHEPSKIRGVIFLFSAAYLISYLTRINFGAIISEMELQTGMARSLLSQAVTAAFVTYGAGQLVSGFLGDRIQPKQLVFFGLLLTASMNMLIPFCGDPWLMTAVWAVNGFAQSLMWPPMVRLMVTLLNGEDYKKACFVVTCAGSVGTVLIYLASPLIITVFSWKMVFGFCSIAAIIMAIFWQKNCVNVPIEHAAPKVVGGKSNSNGLFSPLLIAILFAITLCGILRDGVTTWMPSYISETYNLSSTTSILTGVIMPIFGIACSRLAMIVYRKMPMNPILCAGIFFGVGSVAALGINALTGSSAAASVGLTAVLTGCMHGVNLMLISMLPPFFQKKGNISFISGLLNSFVYIGSAISTYGIALISESQGWGMTVFLWMLIAVAGTIICAFCIPGWKKFASEE